MDEKCDTMETSEADVEGGIQSIRNVIESCSQAAMLEVNLEKELYNAGILSSDNKSMIKLESALLDMAASPDVSDGVFYCLAFKFNDEVIVRHISSGRFEGFLDKVGKELLKDEIGHVPMLFWHVYNHTDVQKRRNHIKEKTKGNIKRSNRQRYHQLLMKQKDSIRNSLNEFPFHLKNDVVIPAYVIVHTVRLGPSKDESDRFLHTIKSEGETNAANELQECLHAHWLLNAAPTVASLNILNLEEPTENPSLGEQFGILSRISNYHWWQYPRVDGKPSILKPAVCASEHLAYHPSSNPDTPPEYLPKSPRNRLLYLQTGIMKKKPHMTSQLVMHLSYIKSIDGEMDVTSEAQTTHDLEADCIEEMVSAKNRRVSNQVDSEEASRYRHFEEIVLGPDGTLLLRIESPEERVYIMNDYNTAKGDIILGKFVHLRSIEDENKTKYVECSCETYIFLRRGSLPNEHLSDKNSPVTCMHCQLFRENLELESDISRRIKSASSEVINTEIVLLGHVESAGSYTFSVLRNNSISFVEITQETICCSFGECIAHKKNQISLLDFVSDQKKKLLQSPAIDKRQYKHQLAHTHYINGIFFIH